MPVYVPSEQFAIKIDQILRCLFEEAEFDDNLAENASDITPSAAHKLIEYLNFKAMEMAPAFGCVGASVIGIAHVHATEYRLPRLADGVFGIYFRFQVRGRPEVLATLAAGNGLKTYRSHI
ncbi:MAG: hypothetical protein PVI21_04130 [Candidatus Woesebacteria bacterium]